MKSLSASLVSAALLIAAVSAQDQNFTINTPNPPTQCVPVQLTWQGGDPPYFLAIIPGGQPQAPALQQYPGLTGTTFTWSVNISAGQSVGFEVTDSQGHIAQSAPVTIQSSPDSSCLNGQSGGSSAASGTGATSAASGSAATSATAPASSATGATTPASGTGSAGATSHPASSGAATSSHASSSAAASATGAAGSNGGLVNVASMGAVGVLSAVAALLLA
ncbi:hypothetical protein BD414DRAFT_551040 [Trametes punicea]|nr:hypothetical protein BD414DRAFT_551040 [Trametes punicea]